MADLACDLGAQGLCSCRGSVSALEDDALLLASVAMAFYPNASFQSRKFPEKQATHDQPPAVKQVIRNASHR